MTVLESATHPFPRGARKFTSCEFPAPVFFRENEVLKKTSCFARKNHRLLEMDGLRFSRSAADLHPSSKAEWGRGHRIAPKSPSLPKRDAVPFRRVSAFGGRS